MRPLDVVRWRLTHSSIVSKHPYHDVEAIGGILEEESADLLKNFFRRTKAYKKPK